MHIFNKQFPEIILQQLKVPQFTQKQRTQALITSIALAF